MQENLKEFKEKFINKLLQHIPFDGWTEKAYKQAFTELGKDFALFSVIFPKGAVDIYKEIIEYINFSTYESIDYNRLATLKTKEKIIYIISEKMNFALPYRDILNTGLSILLLKDRKTILKMTWEDANTIWRLIGDKSLDFNYYSKRSLLSIVLFKTFLFWVGEKSCDNTESIKYLSKNLDSTTKFGQNISKIKNYPKIVTKIPFIRLLFLK